MADSDSGASGILGVLIGVMLVIFLGVGVLMYAGKWGPAPTGIDQDALGQLTFFHENTEDFAMEGIIYLIGLIVVVMAILSLLGLR
jgi:hypothetical protein